MEYSASRTPPSPRVAKGHQLACRQCQRRKIKCDRKFPCGQCDLSELTCQPSTRKKRSSNPQHPKSRKEPAHDGVRGRVARLERLMENFQSEYAWQHDVPDTPQPDPPALDNSALRSKYVAGDFWASLVGEFAALKEALDEDAEVSESDHHKSPLSYDSSRIRESTLGSPNNIDFILCPPGRIHKLPDALSQPDEALQHYLCSVYVDFIDTAWKVFHVPSLKAFLMQNQPYLGISPSDPGNQALKAVIFFAAAYQMTEIDCQERSHQTLSQLLEQLQRNAEAGLVYADVFGTDKLAALQALVVYVATVRKIDSSHRSWLLFSLVERLARAMNVDRVTLQDSFFVSELKRRVWHHICLLDTFFALDRGSAPIIAPGSFSTPFASNINDADFDETTRLGSVQNREDQVTDMTLPLSVQELCHVRHRLGKSPNGRENSQSRLEYVKTCHERINQKYLQHCDQAVPMQRYLMRVNKIMQAMNLMDVVFPLQQPAVGSPCTSAPSEAFDLAMEVLRSSHELWQDSELNKWRRLEWIQWHALAIILAGLCSPEQGLHSDEAWYLIDCTFARSSGHIADATGGKLWLPLRRLYHRAMQLRRSTTPAISADKDAAGQIPESMRAACGDPQAPATAWLEKSGNGAPVAPNLTEPLQQDDAFVADFWVDWGSLLATYDMSAQGTQFLDLVS